MAFVRVMEAPQTMAAATEITESLNLIEADTESDSLRATYDSARDATSLAVTAVVATARGADPRSLPPLQTVIDVDALDRLTAKSATGIRACDSLSFRYDGFDITVTNEDVIEANPIEKT